MVDALGGIPKESLALLQEASSSGELKADATLNIIAENQHARQPKLLYILRKT